MSMFSVAPTNEAKTSLKIHPENQPDAVGENQKKNIKIGCNEEEDESGPVKRFKEVKDDLEGKLLNAHGVEEALTSKLITELPSASWSYMSPVDLLPTMEVAGIHLKFPFNDENCTAVYRKCQSVQARNMKLVELGPSHLSIKSPVWNVAFESSVTSPLLESIRRELAQGCVKITARLNRLRIFERGSFFKSIPLSSMAANVLPARNHFATLLVIFPSFHQGGRLLVRQHGKERAFSFSLSNENLRQEPFKCHVVAFYRSCDWEVTQLTSGHLTMLMYDLHHDGGAAPLLPLSTSTFEDEIASSVTQLFSDQQWTKGKLLGYLLSQRYAQFARPNTESFLKEDLVVYEALHNGKLDIESVPVYVKANIVSTAGPFINDDLFHQASMVTIEIHRLSLPQAEAIETAMKMRRFFQQFGTAATQAEKLVFQDLTQKRGYQMIARGVYSDETWEWLGDVRFVNDWKTRLQQTGRPRRQISKYEFEVELYSLALIFGPGKEKEEIRPAVKQEIDPPLRLSIMGERKMNKGRGPTFSVIPATDMRILEVDAIVNQTNAQLAAVGVVAETLKELAADDFSDHLESLSQRYGTLLATDAVITVSPLPQFKFIIHSNTDSIGSVFEIEQTVYKILNQADKLELRSVAIASIDLPHICGLTKAQCGQAVTLAFRGYFKREPSSCVKHVFFMPSDMEAVGIYLSEIARWE